MLRLKSSLQTQRNPTALCMDRRSRDIDSRHMSSVIRSPCAGTRCAPYLATRCAPCLARPEAPPSDSVSSSSLWLPGQLHFSVHKRYEEIPAVNNQLSSSDRAREACRPARRAGSVATRWEYRNNPLVDLEKVRAFATRHV